jgi:cytoskeleton protein RodZ
MPPIGDTLRQARMRQKLDVADIEERTKIRAKYLRALENEEFGLLPGPTYVKTFLRTYAEVLGLDPHVLVEEYRASYEPASEVDAQPVGAPAPPPRERERRPISLPGPPGPGVVVAAALGTLLVFLLVLGLVSGGDDGGEREASRPPAANKEKKATRRRASRARPTPAAVTLKVSPTVPTYLCLDKGPGTPVVYQGILQDPQTFRGKKLRVNLGKTSAALVANGKPVQIEQGPSSVGFEFSSTGRKQVPAGQRPCQ